MLTEEAINKEVARQLITEFDVPVYASVFELNPKLDASEEERAKITEKVQQLTARYEEAGPNCLSAFKIYCDLGLTEKARFELNDTPTFLMMRNEPVIYHMLLSAFRQNDIGLIEGLRNIIKYCYNDKVKKPRLKKIIEWRDFQLCYIAIKRLGGAHVFNFKSDLDEFGVDTKKLFESISFRVMRDVFFHKSLHEIRWIWLQYKKSQPDEVKRRDILSKIGVNFLLDVFCEKNVNVAQFVWECYVECKFNMQGILLLNRCEFICKVASHANAAVVAYLFNTINQFEWAQKVFGSETGTLMKHLHDNKKLNKEWTQEIARQYGIKTINRQASNPQRVLSRKRKVGSDFDGAAAKMPRKAGKDAKAAAAKEPRGSLLLSKLPR